MADYLGSRMRGITYPTGEPLTVDRTSRSTIYDPTNNTSRLISTVPNTSDGTILSLNTQEPVTQYTNPYLPGYQLPQQAPELQYQSSVASGLTAPTPVPTLDSRIALDQYLSRAYYGGGTDIGPGTVVGDQKAAMGQSWTPDPSLPEGGFWSYINGVPNEIGTAQNYFQLYPQSPEAQNGQQYLTNLASSLGYTAPLPSYTAQAPIPSQQNLAAPTPTQLPSNYQQVAPQLPTSLTPTTPTPTTTTTPTTQTPPNTNNPTTSQPSQSFNDLMQMYLLSQLFGIGGQQQPTGYGVQTGPLGTTYWSPQYNQQNPFSGLNIQDVLALMTLYGMQNSNQGFQSSFWG